MTVVSVVSVVRSVVRSREALLHSIRRTAGEGSKQFYDEGTIGARAAHVLPHYII